MDSLAGIVTDLAALEEPPFDDLTCVLCGAYRYTANATETSEIEAHEHDDACPYRRAVGWVNGVTDRRTVHGPSNSAPPWTSLRTCHRRAL